MHIHYFFVPHSRLCPLIWHRNTFVNIFFCKSIRHNTVRTVILLKRLSLWSARWRICLRHCAERSRVPFPMVSLEFFIDIILPAALWPWGWLSLEQKWVKVKWSRYRPGVAQRVGRGIALLLHGRGTRTGWVVSSTPRPHFAPGKDLIPILQ